MNRWICVLLCACLILGITACSSEGSLSENNSAGNPGTSEDSPGSSNVQQEQRSEGDATQVQDVYDYETRENDPERNTETAVRFCGTDCMELYCIRERRERYQ